MHKLRYLAFVAVSLLLTIVSSCGGGGGGEEARIVSINLNPATVTAGSVIALSASISAPGQSAASVVKNWTVTTGILSANAPDFSLLLRQTARDVSATSLSTAAETVYWVAPATGGSATVTCAVGSDSKNLEVTIGQSPVTMFVTTSTGGAKVCTINASNITDLYQIAFRINFSSAWIPASAEVGSFLGGVDDILSLSMLDQNGFVPMSVTRKGDVDGMDGSGTVASVSFNPSGSAASVRETSDVPFSLAMMILRDSKGQLIPLE